MTLDYLALGHVTLDQQADGGYLPGGTVLFSSVQAARLGLRAGIVTTGRPTALDGPLAPFRSEVAIELHPAATTTIFVNVGVGAARRQTLPEWAGPLDLTGTLPAARIVHLGPVARELDPRSLPTFAPGVFVGATPQGWLRRWDAEGHVTEGELILPPDAHHAARCTRPQRDRGAARRAGHRRRARRRWPGRDHPRRRRVARSSTAPAKPRSARSITRSWTIPARAISLRRPSSSRSAKARCRPPPPPSRTPPPGSASPVEAPPPLSIARRLRRQQGDERPPKPGQFPNKWTTIDRVVGGRRTIGSNVIGC